MSTNIPYDASDFTKKHYYKNTGYRNPQSLNPYKNIDYRVHATGVSSVAPFVARYYEVVYTSNDDSDLRSFRVKFSRTYSPRDKEVNPSVIVGAEKSQVDIQSEIEQFATDSQRADSGGNTLYQYSLVQTFWMKEREALNEKLSVVETMVGNDYDFVIT